MGTNSNNTHFNFIGIKNQILKKKKKKKKKKEQKKKKKKKKLTVKQVSNKRCSAENVPVE